MNFNVLTVIQADKMNGWVQAAGHVFHELGNKEVERFRSEGVLQVVDGNVVTHDMQMCLVQQALERTSTRMLPLFRDFTSQLYNLVTGRGHWALVGAVNRT